MSFCKNTLDSGLHIIVLEFHIGGHIQRKTACRFNLQENDMFFLVMRNRKMMYQTKQHVGYESNDFFRNSNHLCKIISVK